MDHPGVTYFGYDIDGIEYISLFITVPNLPGLMEIHECQANNLKMRRKCQAFLERICRKRWVAQVAVLGMVKKRHKIWVSPINKALAIWQ